MVFLLGIVLTCQGKCTLSTIKFVNFRSKFLLDVAGEPCVGVYSEIF